MRTPVAIPSYFAHYSYRLTFKIELIALECLFVGWSLNHHHATLRQPDIAEPSIHSFPFAQAQCSQNTARAKKVPSITQQGTYPLTCAFNTPFPDARPTRPIRSSRDIPVRGAFVSNRRANSFMTFANPGVASFPVSPSR